jgi:hypothetical protein
MPGDRIGCPEAVRDRATNSMPREGFEGCALRRIEPSRGFHKAYVASADEIVNINTRRKTFFELPRDVNDKGEMPFDKFVRRRPRRQQLVS